MTTPPSSGSSPSSNWRDDSHSRPRRTGSPLEPGTWEAPPSTAPSPEAPPTVGIGPTEDTAKLPATAVEAIVAGERAATGAPAPTSGTVADSAARQGAAPERQPQAIASRRRYAEKVRPIDEIAAIETQRLLSMPFEPESRPARPASRGWQSPWLIRVALVVGLALLALRAGIASAAFMAPGGGIFGWSIVPHTTSPFVQVTPPPTQHQLTPSEYAALLVQQLTLDQELGQMLIVQLRGTNPGPDEDTMVATQFAGGVLYFAYNIQTASQIRASTGHIQQLAPIPLLLSVDQEGGLVDRFKAIAGPQPSAAMLAQLGPDAAQAQGQKDATVLHEYGFNLNLAPVVDVGNANPQLVNPSYPRYGRTFGTDPKQVATMAGAYLTGLQADGTVTGTLKHYPGLGSTTTDPHAGLPILTRSRADWEAIDLLPYRKLLASQDVRAIMVTHIMIPAVDPDLPSTLSPAIIEDTLRQELGFQGVIITDDVFHMAALSSRFPGPQAAVLAVKAGADEIIGPANPIEVRETTDAFKQALANGELTKDRIDLSVQRILTLKIQMGLIPLPKVEGTPTPLPSPSPTPKKPHAGAAPVAIRPTSAA